MDNSKSYCPRTLVKSKKDANMLTLPTKIEGCILYSGLYEENRSITFNLNHNNFEQGGSLVVSTIHNLLLSFFNERGFIPRHLHVFCDNCWRENKVSYFIILFTWIM